MMILAAAFALGTESWAVFLIAPPAQGSDPCDRSRGRTRGAAGRPSALVDSRLAATVVPGPPSTPRRRRLPVLVRPRRPGTSRASIWPRSSGTGCRTGGTGRRGRGARTGCRRRSMGRHRRGGRGGRHIGGARPGQGVAARAGRWVVHRFARRARRVGRRLTGRPPGLTGRAAGRIARGRRYRPPAGGRRHRLPCSRPGGRGGLGDVGSSWTGDSRSVHPLTSSIPPGRSRGGSSPGPVVPPEGSSTPPPRRGCETWPFCWRRRGRRRRPVVPRHRGRHARTREQFGRPIGQFQGVSTGWPTCW